MIALAVASLVSLACCGFGALGAEVTGRHADAIRFTCLAYAFAVGVLAALAF